MHRDPEPAEQRVIRPLLIAVLLLVPPLAAQSPTSVTTHPRPVAQAVRVATGPVLDGRLDDSVWASVPVLAGFLQHEPFDDRPATERSEVRIVFDGEALYIGARLHDSDASGIVRGEVRRDAELREQDAFIIILDTYRDRQNGFVFATTPAGIEHDGQLTKEGEGGLGGPRVLRRDQAAAPNLAWDGTWKVATSVDSAGWTAEFRIPFETLRYAGGRDQEWGLNLARFIRRKSEEDFWSPVPRQYTFYRVSQAGTLTGVQPPTRRIALLTPYGLGTARRNYLDPTTDKADASIEFGADAKLGLTQSLTADLTYNTDFAQVEVDEQQINLTRYNLFFPEKRPFFLENAGTFAVGTPQSVDLFFSRRIGIDPQGRPVPIIGGARLTGRAAGLTLGLLDIQTQHVEVAGLSVTPPNNFAMVRVLRELPNRSQVGAIAVSRLNTDSTGDYNVTLGADGRLGIGDVVTLDAYVARTETPGRNGASNAFNLAGTYTTRQWEATLAARQVDEDFNPEVGFLERPSFRYYNVRLLRHLRTPKSSWFRETRPHINFRWYDDANGRPQSRLLHIDSHFLFANGAFFEAPGLNFVREVLRVPFQISDTVTLQPGQYDWFEFASNFNTNLSSPLSVGGTLTLGEFYTGRRVGLQANVTARPNERFFATARVDYQNVHLDEGHFNRVLLGLRLAYAFTPSVFLQSLTQYNNGDKSLSNNIRFGWVGPAGTGLFLVINEGRETGSNSRPLDRAIIVKFTKQMELGR